MKRRARLYLHSALQYAQWEEGQKDFRRARSVWERALDVSYTNPTTWLKYAEMEMRHRFINHARNVWDRAVSLLPRVDQLWCEPTTQSCTRCMWRLRHPGRQPGSKIQRGCSFCVLPEADMAPHRYKYIHMEEMLGNVPGARQIFERWMAFEPDHHGWIAYIEVIPDSAPQERSSRHASFIPACLSQTSFIATLTNRKADLHFCCRS